MKSCVLCKYLVIVILLFLISPSVIPLSKGINTPLRLPSFTTSSPKTISNDNDSVPDCIKIGDLVFIDFHVDESNPWRRPGLYNEHAAIYVGNGTLVEANGVVRYRNYTGFHEWQKNLAILRVKTATDVQRHAAAAWAESKIGLPYQNFFTFPWFGLKLADTNLSNPTANEFYCMELLWAAYYNQGIDIDRNGWKFPRWVTGNDILNDDDMEIVYREVNDSTEIIKPDKGLYIANTKLTFTIYKTTVIGAIDIEVSTANEWATKVDFYIDSVYKATDTTPPYVWRWNERAFGDKTITAIVSDDLGDHYSAQITVHKIF
jgi:cell wall-associated NlpC family hydrolase